MNETYKLRIELNVLPKSLNKKLRWGAKWSNVSENKAFDRMIYLSARGNLPKEPLKKAKLSIVRHFYRTLDFDGLVGSMKPVVDALVSAGVLADDNWNTVGAWDIDQQFRPKKEGPLLTISVVELFESSVP